MQVIICSLGALAIANLYYFYRFHMRKHSARNRRVRERVAYMLWVAASRVRV